MSLQLLRKMLMFKAPPPPPNPQCSSSSPTVTISYHKYSISLSGRCHHCCCSCHHRCQHDALECRRLHGNSSGKTKRLELITTISVLLHSMRLTTQQCFRHPWLKDPGKTLTFTRRKEKKVEDTNEDEDDDEDDDDDDDDTDEEEPVDSKASPEHHGDTPLDKTNLCQFVNRRRWNKAVRTLTALMRMGVSFSSANLLGGLRRSESYDDSTISSSISHSKSTSQLPRPEESLDFSEKEWQESSQPVPQAPQPRKVLPISKTRTAPELNITEAATPTMDTITEVQASPLSLSLPRGMSEPKDERSKKSTKISPAEMVVTHEDSSPHHEGQARKKPVFILGGDDLQEKNAASSKSKDLPHGNISQTASSKTAENSSESYSQDQKKGNASLISKSDLLDRNSSQKVIHEKSETYEKCIKSSCSKEMPAIPEESCHPGDTPNRPTCKEPFTATIRRSKSTLKGFNITIVEEEKECSNLSNCPRNLENDIALKGDLDNLRSNYTSNTIKDTTSFEEKLALQVDCQLTSPTYDKNQVSLNKSEHPKGRTAGSKYKNIFPFESISKSAPQENETISANTNKTLVMKTDDVLQCGAISKSKPEIKPSASAEKGNICSVTTQSSREGTTHNDISFSDKHWSSPLASEDGSISLMTSTSKEGVIHENKSVPGETRPSAVTFEKKIFSVNTPTLKEETIHKVISVSDKIKPSLIITEKKSISVITTPSRETYQENASVSGKDRPPPIIPAIVISSEMYRKQSVPDIENKSHTKIDAHIDVSDHEKRHSKVERLPATISMEMERKTLEVRGTITDKETSPIGSVEPPAIPSSHSQPVARPDPQPRSKPMPRMNNPPAEPPTLIFKVRKDIPRCRSVPSALKKEFRETSKKESFILVDQLLNQFSSGSHQTLVETSRGTRSKGGQLEIDPVKRPILQRRFFSTTSVFQLAKKFK